MFHNALIAAGFSGSACCEFCMINPSDVLINVQVTSEDRQFQSTVTVADKRYASSEWYEPVTCLENK